MQIKNCLEMYLFGNILVDEEVTNSYFKCDLNKCKGACCTFYGERGAPLKDSEIYILEDIYEVVKNYLPAKAIDVIEQNGLYDGFAGDYTTMCINNRDCVFVYYDDNVAKCAIEKAYFEKKIDFRKPVSCHLFPIRVAKLPQTHCRYEKISECSDAVKLGEKKKELLAHSVSEAMEREFGKEWTKEFLEFCKNGNG